MSFFLATNIVKLPLVSDELAFINFRYPINVKNALRGGLIIDLVENNNYFGKHKTFYLPRSSIPQKTPYLCQIFVTQFSLLVHSVYCLALAWGRSTFNTNGSSNWSSTAFRSRQVYQEFLSIIAYLEIDVHMIFLMQLPMCITSIWKGPERRHFEQESIASERMRIS